MRARLVGAALVLLHAGAWAEPALLDVFVNDSPRGSYAFAYDHGQYFISPADIAKLGIVTKGVGQTVDGALVWSLQGLEGVSTVVDEASLEVHLTAELDRLTAQQISLASASPYGLTPADTSFIGNLRMSADGGYSGSGALLYAENSFRHEAWLMQANLYAQDKTWRSSLVRLSRDFPSRMERVSFGDVPNDGMDGASMRGIWFGRAFEMKPYFQRVPGLAFSAEATVPAIADVYVDGIRVRSVAVKPGPLTLSELNAGAGLHATEVVLHDRAGNILSRFADQRYLPGEGLAEGVSDYAASMGQVSGSQVGAPLGYNLRYARGLTPDLTLGGFSQGAVDSPRYLGLQATAVLGQAGVLSAQATQAGGTAQGFGGVAAFTRQAAQGTFQVQLERYSRRFQSGGLAGDGERRVARYSATYQYTAPAGVVVGVSGARSEQLDGRISQSLTLSLSKRWGALNATLRATTGHGPDAAPGFTLTLSYDLGSKATSGSYVSSARGQVVSGADYSSMGSREQGVGYRLSTQRVGDIQNASAVGQYLHERFSTSFSADTNGKAGQAGGSIASTLVWTQGDGVRVARPIDGAFAVVDARLPGIKVSMDNQYMGTTGEDGRLLVPYLTGWAQHGLSLDEQNIPLDYAVDALQKQVSLPEKGGVVVDFKVHAAQALAGRLLAADGTPLGGRRVALASSAAALRLVTDKAGTFYAEEAAPGVYDGGLVVDGRPCRISLRVPERRTAFMEIGDVTCTAD